MVVIWHTQWWSDINWYLNINWNCFLSNESVSRQPDQMPPTTLASKDRFLSLSARRNHKVTGNQRIGFTPSCCPRSQEEENCLLTSSYITWTVSRQETNYAIFSREENMQFIIRCSWKIPSPGSSLMVYKESLKVTAMNCISFMKVLWPFRGMWLRSWSPL